MSRFCTEAEIALLREHSDPPPPVVDASDLDGRGARTLLYGYTVERDTFHVYLGDDGEIHRLVYRRHLADDMTDSIEVLEHTHGALPVTSLVPNKRVYPESLDHEFAMLLRGYGVRIPLTTWDQGRAGRLAGHAFHGVRHQP